MYGFLFASKEFMNPSFAPVLSLKKTNKMVAGAPLTSKFDTSSGKLFPVQSWYVNPENLGMCVSTCPDTFHCTGLLPNMYILGMRIKLMSVSGRDLDVWRLLYLYLSGGLGHEARRGNHPSNQRRSQMHQN